MVEPFRRVVPKAKWNGVLLNSSLTEDQERFTTLIRDPRLTPAMMLDVMNNAMGLQPDVRRALPGEAHKAPVGGRGMIASWPEGALAGVMGSNALGTLCDALEERLALLPIKRRSLP
jgi:hypothetical protein